MLSVLGSNIQLFPPAHKAHTCTANGTNMCKSVARAAVGEGRRGVAATKFPLMWYLDCVAMSLVSLSLSLRICVARKGGRRGGVHVCVGTKTVRWKKGNAFYAR